MDKIDAGIKWMKKKVNNVIENVDNKEDVKVWWQKQNDDVKKTIWNRSVTGQRYIAHDELCVYDAIGTKAPSSPRLTLV